MLRYGAGEEMVFLTRMKNVGGATARTLYNAGFRTPEAIMEATAGELEKLPRIGKKLAASIISQAESLAFLLFPMARSLELSVAGGDGGRYRVTGGREPHIVSFRDGSYHCDCMDHQKNCGITPCKHILRVRYHRKDEDVVKMAERLKSKGSMTLREAIPSLWYDHP